VWRNCVGACVDIEEMTHEGGKAGRFEDRSAEVIAACIEVHRHLGPGLLESAYEHCLCHELSLRGLGFERQRPLPLAYKGVHLHCGYRLDIVVGKLLIVEVKAVERLLPVHEAQALTYLRLTGLPAALLVNFNVAVLRHGLRRLTYNPNHPFPPSRLHVT
jgi:GxxExxY protein